MACDPVALSPLPAYGVSATTGFVPEADPLARLPEAFDAWEAAVPNLSALIRSRELRPAFSRLPQLDPLTLPKGPSRERALLLLTVFANGWVWGDAEPDLVLPPHISIPLWRLAQEMDRPPLVHYASMALHNWRRLDPTRPLSAENATMQVQFLGGVDEDWFFIGSLAVELAGVPMVVAAHELVNASLTASDAALTAALEQLGQSFAPVTATLARMFEWCDPHVFYHRVRPYLAGWPEPGVLYQGACDTPRVYAGGSAGQSSLIQLADAALSVDHQPASTRDYLRRLRAHMPPDHRGLIEAAEARTRVRARALAGGAPLKAAYNATVHEVHRFRRAHIGLAQHYIARFAADTSVEKGTGGTSFADFLDSAGASTAGTAI